MTFNTPLLAIGLSTALLLVSACGNNSNNIVEVGQPSIQLSSPVGNTIQLELPNQPNRPRSQTGKIVLQSKGEEPLIIQSVTWVDQPQGLYLQKKRTEVDSCGDCNSPVCLDTAGQDFCIETGGPDLPLAIAPQSLYEFEFFIEANLDEVICAPAPANLPSTVNPETYCGSLEIKTNARNDSQNVTQGTALIYFARSNASGKIALTPGFISFNGVKPGSSDQKTFSISNTGSSNLILSGIEILNRPEFFTLNGVRNTTITPGGSEQYTLQLTIPTDASPEQLDFNTEVSVNSSAANQSTLVISVNSTEAAAPRIDVSQSPLSFTAPSSSEEVVVENVGEATLSVNSIRFNPSSLDSFYTVELNGSEFTSAETIQKGSTDDVDRNKRTFTVKFNRPAGNDTSAVGFLEIRHSDKSKGNLTRIPVLGDGGLVAFPEVLPEQHTFDQATADTRSFAIKNFGTADFVISNIKLAPEGESAFVVNNGSTDPITVGPGQVYEGVVKYTPAQEPARVSVNVEFENAASFPLDMGLASRDAAGSITVASIDASFVNNAVVGEAAVFNATGSTNVADINSSKWFLLSQPSGSTAELNASGESVSFTPDTAGTYRVSLVVVGTSTNDQEILEFTAQ